MRTIFGIVALLTTAMAPAAGTAQEFQNWFNDPFFQVANADPSCPEPAGPFVDERNRMEQAHHRAEKGTSCWLARECDRPKAYLYDQDIAAGIRQAFQRTDVFAASTLWVTVQGRVVYIEGCVSEPSAAAQLESFIRVLPYVQQAIAIVRTNPSAAPPYQLRQHR